MNIGFTSDIGFVLQVPTPEDPNGQLPPHGLWIVETRTLVKEHGKTDEEGAPVEVYMSRFQLCFEGKIIAPDMPEEHARNLLAVLCYYFEFYTTFLPEVLLLSSSITSLVRNRSG